MDAKISQLLDQLIELRADPAEIAKLSELLKSDPDAALEYLNLLRVHQGMSNLVAPVRDFSAPELLAIQSVDQRLGKYFGPEAEPDGGSEELSRPTGGAATVVTRGPHLLPWVVAALAVAAALALAFLPQRPIRDRLADGVDEDSHHSASAAGDQESVARVVKKVDCDWQEDRWNVATSVDIRVGQQINLSRGMLVLKFDSGPEVTLNGPATFVATSRTSAQLLEGTLSARVPPEGRGFRVETHAGDFVDLGTEFGMIITKEGAVETHVFKGQVRAEPVATGDQRTSPVLLEQGEAWSRQEQGETVVSKRARPERFMRLVTEGEHKSLSRPPLDKEVSLWFDAAEGVQLDPQKRA
ncbi:MAG: FecR domain-containing protein, partial [Planctomycetales bacterium]|nr:FecR domain-containing protein [Planctomycetales bacterium]